MDSWTLRPMMAVDTETTSADPMSARIVTACVSMIDLVDTVKVETRTWLLDPEIEIEEGAAEVHGITTEKARAEGQNYAKGYAEIRSAIESGWANGYLACLYNAAFDLTLIDQEGRRLGYDKLAVGNVIDGFVIDRALDPYRKGRRRLENACEHYGVKLDGAHQADADAIAAARLAWKLPRVYGELVKLTPEELHRRQVKWHFERQADFKKYLVSQGKDASDVNGDWPVRQTLKVAS
jgi:DNA polymerase-3 subunit epsilon